MSGPKVTRTKKAAKPQAPRATTKKPAGQAKTAAKPQRLSQIEAAVQVLAQAGGPMTCKAMVEAMAHQGLWTSPGGATPEATLASSILRDLRHGKDARFQKVDRGQFALAARQQEA